MTEWKWFLFLLSGFCAIRQKWGKAENFQLMNPPIQMYKMIDISKHRCQVLEDVKDLAGLSLKIRYATSVVKWTYPRNIFFAYRQKKMPAGDIKKQTSKNAQ